MRIILAIKIAIHLFNDVKNLHFIVFIFTPILLLCFSIAAIYPRTKDDFLEIMFYDRIQVITKLCGG